MSSASKVSVSRANAFGLDDTLTASIGMPLQVDGGRISVDMPVARAAAAGGERSDSVIWATDEIELDGAARSYELGSSYAFSDPGEAASFVAEGGLTTGPRQEAFIGLNLVKRFSEPEMRFRGAGTACPA
ncbi:hypothetical protein [Roseivivax sp. CAU 1761]